MGYSAVTAFAYFSASGLSLLLTAFLLHASVSERWKLPLSIAAALQTLWLSFLSFSLLDTGLSERLILLLESSQCFGWLLAFCLSLKHLRREAWPPRLKITLWIGSATWVASVFDLLVSGASGAFSVFLYLLVLSGLALVSLEQLIRNTYSGRFLKLLGLSLALVFIFNIYLYAQGLITRSMDLFLWQARAAVVMASSFLIVSAGLLFRDNVDEPSGIGLSRPVAFYSTSLLLTSAGVLLLAIGSYYVRSLGGQWGIYLFTLLFFFFIAGLSTLFLSNRIRQLIQVWISKHFFRHKYDYRREWLKVNQALATTPQSSQVYTLVYSVIAEAFHANGGSVWLRKGPHFREVYSRNQTEAPRPESVPINDAFIDTMTRHQWVFVPGAEEEPLANFNAVLPDWIRNRPNLKLVVPLITQSQLLGFVLLEKNRFDTDLTWEDLDVLKTMGRQLANHILIHSQEALLSESRQLDTYHKLSAFIMHDMNNLIAQLALMVKNSERHKNNPAFIDDMIRTVSNAVERMNQLLQKFNRSNREVVTKVSLLEAVRGSIAACTSGKPSPRLLFFGGDRTVRADRDRLVLALKHLIKNAQDATEEDGSVEVRVDVHDSGVTTVKITDSGVGMTPEFIEQRLFKPFETTKKGQGMGIGVYLTRSYLEELGASLEVESTPGIGTTMTIHFGHIQTDGATAWTSLTESY